MASGFSAAPRTGTGVIGALTKKPRPGPPRQWQGSYPPAPSLRPPVRAAGLRARPCHCQKPARHPPPRVTDPLRKAGSWNPSSRISTFAPAAWATCAVAARSRPTQTGAKAAISSGSSPTSVALCWRSFTCNRTGSTARHSRANRTCGCTPHGLQHLHKRNHRGRFASAANIDITHADNRHPRRKNAQAARHAARSLRRKPAPSGANSTAMTDQGRNQKAGGCMASIPVCRQQGGDKGFGRFRAFRHNLPAAMRHFCGALGAQDAAHHRAKGIRTA